MAIVGSGAGGAVAAAVLAEAGLDVLVLESGPYVDHRDYPTDPLEGLPMMYRDGGLTIAQGRPAIPIPVGRTVGGTTVINSGTCFRAPDEVLRAWRDEAGVPWATDLAPDYASAEEMLQVRQLDIETLGRNGQLCAEGAEALGASGGPISRNAGACVQCSSCPLGCQIDAKRAAHVSYLPRAVAAGARVRAGVEGSARVDARTIAHAGLECLAGFPTTAAEERARNGNGAGGRPWHVRAQGGDQRRRRVRHARAAAALGHLEPTPRPPPPRPPRGLDRRPLPRGGPRLGRRDAELLRRRVAAPGHPARGDLHPPRPSAPSGCPASATPSPTGWRTTATSPRSASTCTTTPRAASGSPAAATCGSPTSSRTRRRKRSSSGSPALLRSTSPPGPTRSTRNVGACTVIPRGKLADFEAMDLKPVRPAPRGLPPDVNGADGHRPRRQRDRPRRRRARDRGPLRRRRGPAARPRSGSTR